MKTILFSATQENNNSNLLALLTACDRQLRDKESIIVDLSISGKLSAWLEQRPDLAKAKIFLLRPRPNLDSIQSELVREIEQSPAATVIMVASSKTKAIHNYACILAEQIITEVNIRDILASRFFTSSGGSGDYSIDYLAARRHHLNGSGVISRWYLLASSSEAVNKFDRQLQLWSKQTGATYINYPPFRPQMLQLAEQGLTCLDRANIKQTDNDWISSSYWESIKLLTQLQLRN